MTIETALYGLLVLAIIDAVLLALYLRRRRKGTRRLDSTAAAWTPPAMSAPTPPAIVFPEV
jgi:hypothetical protein